MYLSTLGNLLCLYLRVLGTFSNSGAAVLLPLVFHQLCTTGAQSTTVCTLDGKHPAKSFPELTYVPGSSSSTITSTLQRFSRGRSR